MNDIAYWFTTEDGVHVPVKRNETKVQAMNRVFNEDNNQSSMSSKIMEKETLHNRESLVNYVKHQTNIDLNNYATEKQSHPRRYLNIDTKQMNPNDFREIQGILSKYGHNMKLESNGVTDYAIEYEKKV